MGDEQDEAQAGLSFGTIFDLISAEYGWTDDQILDLTLGRIRLALESIEVRRNHGREFQLMVAEAITKTIVGAMPALAQSKKAGKSLANMAKHLSFLPRDREESLPSTQSVERMFRG